MSEPPTKHRAGPSRSLTRWLPLAVLGAAMAFAFAMGWHKWLTLEAVGMNYAALRGFIDQNIMVALLVYVAAYVAVVALSLPGGLIMTIAGGLLFGWMIAVPAILVAATTGATIVFLVARSSLGGSLSQSTAPWLEKLRSGFKENALSYLLFLRLVPVFPFVVVNLAPALLGVPLSTYIIGTFLGIIPGTTAFAIAGAGLGSVVEAQNAAYADCIARAAADPSVVCTYGVDASALVTPELLAAFAVMGIVALIPVAAKKWSNRHAAE